MLKYPDHESSHCVFSISQKQMELGNGSIHSTCRFASRGYIRAVQIHHLYETTVCICYRPILLLGQQSVLPHLSLLSQNPASFAVTFYIVRGSRPEIASNIDTYQVFKLPCNKYEKLSWVASYHKQKLKIAMLLSSLTNG